MRPSFVSLTIRLLLLLVSVSGALPLSADERPVERDASGAEQRPDRDIPALYLIGDSTVKVSTAAQKGWGEEIGVYFDPAAIAVVNRAIGGRSSRTFLTDGRWDRILAELRAGDIVLMQFGHNDGGAINDDSRARGTLPGTGDESQSIENLLTKRPEVVRTYGWYLRKYVRDTLAKGGVPIVCSPVPRKIWSDNGKIARTPNSYPDWAETIAREEGVEFIDLHEIIARRYEQLGPEQVQPFFADERTHTTAAGAGFSAEAVVAGLKALPGDRWARYLSAQGKQVAPAAND